MQISSLWNKYRLRHYHKAACTILLGVALQLISAESSFAIEVPGGCGVLTGGHDYRPDRYKPNSTFPTHRSFLNMVETHHFTRKVEALVQGESSYIAGDIAYTLNAFPNHHRALMAMEALGEKEQTNKPSHSDYSVECWFRRAVAFGPDDLIVRMIFARYLAKSNRPTEAEEQLSFAANRAGSNALTHNNVGLIYFDWKNYDKALVHAHKAYELGLGVPTLRDQLKRIGKWTESVEVPLTEPSNDPRNPATKSSITIQE